MEVSSCVILVQESLLHIHVLVCIGTYTVYMCLTNVCRWWPGQVVPMTDIPDNIKKKQPGEGMFVIRYQNFSHVCTT